MVFTINQYIRNAAMYSLKKIVLFFVLILVAVLSFNIAFNQFRVRTFVDDAFTVRANAVLENTGTEHMKNFFDENFLTNDDMINHQPYAAYDVSRYDYKLDINYISVGWVAPSRANVVISEYVTDIKGQYIGNQEEKAGGAPDAPPEWKPAKYKVKLKKSEGRWFITEMEKIKDLT